MTRRVEVGEAVGLQRRQRPLRLVPVERQLQHQPVAIRPVGDPVHLGGHLLVGLGVAGVEAPVVDGDGQGDLCDEDKQTNEDALNDGGRIFSAYHLSHCEKAWGITEADRSSTCVLLPSEY